MNGFVTYSGQCAGLNVLGIVENMAGLTLPLSSLSHPQSGVRLMNSRGEDMTDSLLLRCRPMSVTIDVDDTCLDMISCF